MSDHDGRAVTLFGGVYVWQQAPSGWVLLVETPAERAARVDAARTAADAARAKARELAADDDPTLVATLARIDSLELAATR